MSTVCCFLFNDTATTDIYTYGHTLSLHDALPIYLFVMAGVPHITAGMLDALTGELEGGAPLTAHTIGAWAPESEVADILRAAEIAHADRKSTRLNSSH